jgi:hypothetical protein
MRRHYRQRRDTLLDALHRWLPVASVSGTAAGLHLVLRLPDAIPASKVVETAARQGLALTAVQRYVLLDGTARDDCLVLGFGNIATSVIDVAVRRLADAVSTVRGRSIDGSWQRKFPELLPRPTAASRSFRALLGLPCHPDEERIRISFQRWSCGSFAGSGRRRSGFSLLRRLRLH